MTFFVLLLFYFVHPGGSTEGQGAPELASKSSALVNTSFTNAIQGSPEQSVTCTHHALWLSSYLHKGWICSTACWID